MTNSARCPRRFVRCASLAMALVILVGGAAPLRADSPTVKIDGSSTVAPITMAAAELYREVESGTKVTVGVSGTGGGFKKFLDEKAELRTDINDASRPIDKKEMELASSRGIEFIELPIALDGMAIITHPSNKFCTSLTVAELKAIWSPDSKINNWKDVRAGFPDLPLKLFGPGTNSGTFDYFTEVIVGKAKSSRSDYTASENDNVLVHGVSGDKGSLGYFGFSYYEANSKKLNLVPIDGGSGKAVLPSLETIRSGEYSPLSRPVFLYVNKASLERSEVRGFLEFLYKDPVAIVEHPRVQYVALPPAVYEACRQRLAKMVTGSAMSSHHAGGTIDLESVYKMP